MLFQTSSLAKIDRSITFLLCDVDVGCSVEIKNGLGKFYPTLSKNPQQNFVWDMYVSGITQVVLN